MMKYYRKDFFWKTERQFRGFWPCFKAPFDEYELGRLHMALMEEQESTSIEQSSRGRRTKKKHIKPAKINEDTEAELFKKYSKAKPELALILLRVYRLWLRKPQLSLGHKPWVNPRVTKTRRVKKRTDCDGE